MCSKFLCIFEVNLAKVFGFIHLHVQAAEWRRTARSRILFQKLISLKLMKKFLAFCGTRKFINALTKARHLSLSWAKSIQSVPTLPTFPRSVLIVPSHLSLSFPSVFFRQVSPLKSYMHLSPPLYMPLPSHSSWFHLSNILWILYVILRGILSQQHWNLLYPAITILLTLVRVAVKCLINLQHEIGFEDSVFPEIKYGIFCI
jgi:hypothetical protein